MNYLLILIFSALIVNPCNKENKESSQPKQESASNQIEIKNTADVKDDGLVYLGRYNRGRLLVEDNKTYEKNSLTWAKDTIDNYGKYMDYLKSIAVKYSSYKEEVFEYFFDKDLDEFKKLTTLKKGDKFYIATKSGVIQSEVTGFFINLDDMVGSGVGFYAVAETGKTNFTDFEIVICSKNSKMSKLNTNKRKDSSQTVTDIKDMILQQVKDIKVKDESSEKEKFIPVSSIDTSELAVFIGSFTSPGALQYIAGYTKRQSFDNFAYYIIILNDRAEIVKTFAALVKDSFTYETVIGIVDVNGDGIYEILTEDGYYEGSGYNLHKFDGIGFNVVASGFFFGV